MKAIGGRRTIKDDTQFISAMIRKKSHRKTRSVELNKRNMEEKKIEKQCLDWLWLYRSKLRYGKTEMGSTYNGRYLFFGFPDLTVFNLETKILWFIEIKRPDRKNEKDGGLSDKQVNFKNYVDQVGGNIKYLIVYSKDEMGKIL